MVTSPIIIHLGKCKTTDSVKWWSGGCISKKKKKEKKENANFLNFLSLCKFIFNLLFPSL